MCDFSPIYDRLNINNNNQHPLFTFNIDDSRTGKTKKIGKCGIENNVEIFIDTILINGEIERMTQQSHPDADNIRYIPIYFLVMNVKKDKHEYEIGTHVALFVYFNYIWHSIGLARCDTETSNLLTPDNVFKTVNENMRVLDVGILTIEHLTGIKQFITYTTDVHYNTKSSYYTLNLNKRFNNFSLLSDTNTYACSKFIYTIFISSLTCNDPNSISIDKLSRTNQNYINCLAFQHTMTLREFKMSCLGSTSIFNHMFCMAISGLANISDILGGGEYETKKQYNVILYAGIE